MPVKHKDNRRYVHSLRPCVVPMQYDMMTVTLLISHLYPDPFMEVAAYRRRSVQCSVTTSGQDKHDELLQQEQAMAAFMDSFASNKAARLAELEGMQMAGSSRRLLSGGASAPDVPSLPFDDNQARRASLSQAHSRPKLCSQASHCAASVSPTLSC